MLFPTLRFVVAALGLSGLLVATAVPAHAQLQLQAKAKSEGAFVLYVEGPTTPWEVKAKIFEQRYPGIKVSITEGDFSNVLDKKVDQQLSEDKVEVDASIFKTLQDYSDRVAGSTRGAAYATNGSITSSPRYSRMQRRPEYSTSCISP